MLRDAWWRCVVVGSMLVCSCSLLSGCLVLGTPEVCEEVEDDCATSPLLGDRQDNDCDGVVDEGCGCDYRGLMRGVCVDGAISQMLQECALPRDYVDDELGQCDGLDNDCDGQVDEGCPCNVDGSSAGVCALGRFVETGVCSPPVLYALQESSCDGYDNDCDGMVDEGCDRCTFLGSLIGVCAHGRQVMDPMSGSPVCAPPTNYVSDENDCATDPFAGDNVDNDCDGQVDEGCACNYGDESRGVCSRGRLIENSCSPPPEYKLDESNSACDGLDNDCDGYVDNGCTAPEMQG